MVNNFLPRKKHFPTLWRWLGPAYQALSLNLCPLCRTVPLSREPLCKYCIKVIIKQRLSGFPACVSCALPLRAQSPQNGLQLFCGHCQQNKPYFERCLAATIYAPATARLINQLKHSGQLSALKPIAHEMQLMLENHPTHTVDALIPVPLHPARLLYRGFNQSLEIAKLLAKPLAIPLEHTVCIRPEAGLPQQTLNRETRIRNLKNAFRFTQRLDGKRIALIDDVVTTTATTDSIARQALSVGALAVEVWCFARTPAPAPFRAAGIGAPAQ